MLREKLQKKKSTPNSRLNENYTEYYVINFSFYTVTIFIVCLKPNSEHYIHIAHE